MDHLEGSQAGFTDPTSINTDYIPQPEDLVRGFVTLVLRTPGQVFVLVIHLIQ